MKHWHTSRRQIPLTRPLVMGILNVTPDSFNDGGRYTDVEAALRRVETMIEQRVDIIDIGGESTRPGSERVAADEELRRTIPVIEAAAKRWDVPISIDTSKSEVARAALNAGAEIVNDISGLRWDSRLGEAVAAARAGIVVMHSRGEFETMHAQPPVENVIDDVMGGLDAAIVNARASGIPDERIVLDVGIGFGKTPSQNLELLAKLDRIAGKFPDFPLLVGASRKSFIGTLTGGADAKERLGGSMAAAIASVEKGARVVRVHDVAETIQALRIREMITQEV